jgi:hypothetical protein
MKRSTLLCLALTPTLLLAASHVQAHARDEAVILVFDGGALIPVSSTARRAFDPGFAGGVGLYHTWSPHLAVGLRAHGGFFTRDNPGGDASGFGLFSAALRFRPFVHHGDVRRAVGPWFEGGMGLGLLNGPGDDLDPNFTLEAAAGWGIPAGPIGLSPFFRAMHFFHPTERDVVAVVFGIEVNLFDRRLQ